MFASTPKLIRDILRMSSKRSLQFASKSQQTATIRATAETILSGFRT